MAVNLFRKPGDPFDPLLGPLQTGVFSRGYNRSTAAPAAPVAPAVATPVPMPAAPAYTPPAKGTKRGSAGFGMGLGTSNYGGFNINEWGAGLWAQGIDVNAPTLGETVKSVITQKQTAGAYYDKDFNERVPEAAAKNNWNLSTDSGRIEALDWYYRDLGRRMDQSNSFLDSTIGKVLSIGAQVAASFIPGIGPAVSAAIGATTGGLQGGPLGALTGAIGGYGIGKGVQFIANGGIQSTFGSLFSKAAPIVEGAGTASGVAGAASSGPLQASTSLFGKVGTAVKGALSSGGTVNTVASVANAGLGIRDLLTGGAVAGAAVLAAQTIPASSGAPATPTPPPATVKTDEELQREREVRRRRVSETNLTWGNTLLAPNVRKPSLLGGVTKLAA